MWPFPHWFTPEQLCKCDSTLYSSPGEHNTLPHQPDCTSLEGLCVFCAGTPLIGAPTWTECSTSMQVTGQCLSSGSWTEKSTPGTTFPSSPQSSVSEANISVNPLPLILPTKLNFLNWYYLWMLFDELTKGDFVKHYNQTSSSPIISCCWSLFPTLSSIKSPKSDTENHRKNYCYYISANIFPF